MMTEHSHAEHRPPVDKDASTLGPPPPGTTLAGAFYPMNDVLGVIHDRATAERAVQALREAGVPAGDVDLLDGPWFAEAMGSIERHGGVGARLAALLQTDERRLVERYVAEAEQGHCIVAVHAPQPQGVERARRVLAAHGAREMRHYGRSVITDL
jgi:hypothetical protein